MNSLLLSSVPVWPPLCGSASGGLHSPRRPRRGLEAPGGGVHVGSGPRVGEDAVLPFSPHLDEGLRGPGPAAHRLHRPLAPRVPAQGDEEGRCRGPRRPEGFNKGSSVRLPGRREAKTRIKRKTISDIPEVKGMNSVISGFPFKPLSWASNGS